MGAFAKRADRRAGWIVGAAFWLVLAGCDAGEPPYVPELVVEAFLEAGQPLGGLTLRRTLPTDAPSGNDAVTDAGALVRLSGQSVPLVHVGSGRYRPASPALLVPGSVLAFEATWQGSTATATTTVPPVLRLDSVRVEPASAPVRAILLEQFGFDPASIPREGFVYPVRVRAYWQAPAVPDTGLWVRVSLRPSAGSSVQFFFPPEVVRQEQEAVGATMDARYYEGVYAVRVASETAPLPAHTLRVALVRGGTAYARFITTRSAPDRREPISNVTGGRGLFAAVSTDSVRVNVR
ncbi:MAG TPA: DUF4249 family protein [Rhodothermales bacterium]|nr:DUF4249 family protein [Rhodothermales bacterium]